MRASRRWWATRKPIGCCGVRIASPGCIRRSGVSEMSRRALLSAGAATLARAAAPAGEKVKFGLDLFSVRSQGWTPFQHLDFAAKWGIQVVHFSEVRFVGGLEEENLRKVRAYAEKLGIEVEIGML